MLRAGILPRISENLQICTMSHSVQTWMGRTGKWWAFENHDVRPDVTSMAKGLQGRFAVAAAGYVK